MSSPRVHIRSYASASAVEVRAGLIAYIALDYGDLILDGITLRRTAEGRFALSFPARTDRVGRRHAYIRPIDATARAQIEAAVLALLGEGEVER